MDDINIILASYPGLGRVRLCECNSVHISIGPVTINLAPEAFSQMAVLIRNAMEQFTEIAEAKGSARGPLRAFEPQHSRFTN
ncbi:MAG TPA: hypothetical protein VFE22_04945 [Edaphobacter sp.]|jgi:hypothetical protein|nr:hypothetical protein [Edaphobacter sp.]